VPGEATATTLLWPVTTLLGFCLLAALIIALGASSTARYEFERNAVAAQRRQGAVGAEAAEVTAARGSEHRRETADDDAARAPEPRRATAVGVAAHPAGKGRVDPAAVPAWWLLGDDGDGAGGHVVAGPFDDRIDAEWFALSEGLGGLARPAHGVQRAGGRLVTVPQPSEKDWLGELGEQLDRLPEAWDELFTDDDALTTLVVEVAAALVEAGLPVHDCAGDGAAGGLCLTPGPHHAGVVVSWHPHHRLGAQWLRGPALTTAVQRTMNAAAAELLVQCGFEVEAFGPTGSSLVTDLRRSA
jgi:hypothetical protein